MLWITSPTVRIERPAHVERTGEFGRADAVGVHADLRQRVRDVHEQAEDADRTGDRGRLGENLVAVHRDPVAARRGDIAHRHDDRLVRGLGQLDFAPDQFRRERIAARRVHAQHDRAHAVVLARAADQFGGRFAADRAGRLVAAEDLALGHDDGDLRARVRQRVRAARARQIILEVDLAERLACRARPCRSAARTASSRVASWSTSFCSSASLAMSPSGRLDRGRVVVDLRGDRLRIELARRADVGEVVRPHAVHPVQVGFLGFRRGVVADVGFGRRLEFADAEQVHVDAELVERVLVVTCDSGRGLRAARRRPDAAGSGWRARRGSTGPGSCRWRPR